ncbi:MAG: hypothetical protein F6J93_21250 [Oscillatoria sp. SIO1A7]|nr:hypothetical protein [Oscillatoria sp. SIO1A7]
MSCNNQFEGNGCPIVNDPSRPSRFVCLKCGIDRDINEDENNFGNLFIAIIALAVMGFFLSNNNPVMSTPELPVQLQQNK